jgi:hypothetical protein
MNATMSISWTLQFLGILAYFQTDYDRAGRYFVESLEGSPQGGSQFLVPLSLEGVAGVLAKRSQPERAAKLLGAAEALREVLNLHRPPIECGLYEPILASICTQLAEESRRTAWQSGRHLSLEQAVAEAEAALRR